MGDASILSADEVRELLNRLVRLSEETRRLQERVHRAMADNEREDTMRVTPEERTFQRAHHDKA